MVLEQVAKARTLIIPEKNKIRIATRLQEGKGKVPYSKKKEPKLHQSIYIVHAYNKLLLPPSQ
jgi:hypothetical protein